jgi:hypothetical protein
MTGSDSDRPSRSELGLARVGKGWHAFHLLSRDQNKNEKGERRCPGARVIACQGRRRPIGPAVFSGNAAAARVWLIASCKERGHRVEPDAAEMAERYGANTAVPKWREPDSSALRAPSARRHGGDRGRAVVVSTALPYPNLPADLSREGFRMPAHARKRPPFRGSDLRRISARRFGFISYLSLPARGRTHG